MKSKSLVRLGALAVLWGSGFLFIKEALTGLSPFQIVFGRVLTAAVAMLALVLATKRRLPTDRRIWIHLAVMAVITNIAPYFLFAWAELRVTSGLAGVLNATTPLFTLLAALATGTERHAPSRLAGLLVGLLGVVILAAPWATPQRSTLAGIIAALLASACYAFGYVYARRFLTSRAVPPVILSTGQMVAGTVLLALVAPILGRGHVHLTATVIAAVLALGIVGTGASYVLNYQLIADEGPTAASTANYLIPIVAVILGTVILAEPVTWNLALGAITILAGVAISEGRLAHPLRTPHTRQPANP
jgi:drug/metabolite transporter (DMT)-like permease